MTSERFEELVEIGAKAAQLSTSNFEEDHVRAALTAVYPLIRDEVIEECAAKINASDSYGNWPWAPSV